MEQNQNSVEIEILLLFEAVYLKVDTIPTAANNSDKADLKTAIKFVSSHFLLEKYIDTLLRNVIKEK